MDCNASITLFTEQGYPKAAVGGEPTTLECGRTDTHDGASAALGDSHWDKYNTVRWYDAAPSTKPHETPSEKGTFAEMLGELSILRHQLREMKRDRDKAHEDVVRITERANIYRIGRDERLARVKNLEHVIADRNQKIEEMKEELNTTIAEKHHYKETVLALSLNPGNGIGWDSIEHMQQFAKTMLAQGRIRERTSLKELEEKRETSTLRESKWGDYQ